MHYSEHVENSTVISHALLIPERKAAAYHAHYAYELPAPKVASKVGNIRIHCYLTMIRMHLQK